MTPKNKSSFFRRDDSKPAPATEQRTERSDRPYTKAPSRGADRRDDRPARSFDRSEKSDRPYSKAPSRGADRRDDRPARPFDRRDDNRSDRPARSFDRSDKPYSKAPSRGADRRDDRPARPFDRRDDNRSDRPARPFDRSEKSDRPYSKTPSRGADRSFDRSEKPYSKTPSRFAADKLTERVERPERKTRTNESFSPRTEKPKKSFAAPKTAEMPTVLRLNRFIAQSGICSRREADELIKRGEIMVNDVVVIELGQKVDTTTDIIKYNGKPLTGEKLVYIIMNKPKGFVTTTEDPHAEQTVIDLLKGQVRERVYPVGRLDKNTTGVLLLTNDGDLTRELTHPSFEKRKIYHVFLDQAVTEEHLAEMAKGIELEDGMMAADQVSYVDGNRKEVGVEIHSGRNRIVRRMFEHFEYRVVKLDRVYFAGFTKEGLRRGFWRPLTAREVATLKGGQFK